MYYFYYQATFYLSCFLFTKSVSTTVLIAEEGKPYNLSHTWKYNERFDLEFVWREKYLVSKCTADEQCLDYEQSLFKTSMKSYGNKTFTTSLLIYKVERQHENITWALTYLGHMALVSPNITSFKIIVVAPAKGLMCQKSANETELIVTCRTLRIFPQGLCKIIVDSEHNQILWESTISEETLDIKNYTYFQTSCSVSLAMWSLQRDRNEITFLLYPNVTNSEQDLRFSTKETVHFKASLAKGNNASCKSNVEAGHINISCNVYGIFPEAFCHFNITQNKNHYQNYSMNYKHTFIDGESIMFDSSCNISLPIETLCSGNYEVNINIYSRGRDDDLNYVTTFDFNFNLVSGANVSCEHKLENQILNITCNILEIFPKAMCTFRYQYGNTDRILSENIQYIHVYEGKERINYNSTCSATTTIPMTNNSHQNIYVIADIHPEVSCQFNDVNQTYFNINVISCKYKFV